MAKVLVVEDQAAVRTALELLFQLHGLEVLLAATPAEALALLADEDVGVIVQDMNFAANNTSGAEGVDLFRELRRLDPDVPVVLMTAWTSLETAVELVKEGAADYIGKPWDDRKLVLTVQNLLRLAELGRERARLRARSHHARAELARESDLCGLVYESAELHAVVRLAVHVAASDVPVLVTGPNGAGKERLAHIVQANSRRKNGPFIKVNAGALPDNLIEAELFGAEAGAFTGATKLRVGRFEAANQGTLFLDEIGNLSPSGQMRLLRVLQTGEYERLGSSQTRKTDVRVISATNANLKQAISEGRFREDLYFRLNVIELELPALGDRLDDVLPLARHFLSVHGLAGQAKAAIQLDASAERALLDYDWPGNARELENRIQRALLVCQGSAITDRDLALPQAALARRPAAPAKREAAPHADAPASTPGGGGGERERIEQALAHAEGVISRAATELGLSRQALYRRMERLGMTVERRLRDVT